MSTYWSLSDSTQQTCMHYVMQSDISSTSGYTLQDTNTIALDGSSSTSAFSAPTMAEPTLVDSITLDQANTLLPPSRRVPSGRGRNTLAAEHTFDFTAHPTEVAISQVIIRLVFTSKGN